MTMNLGKVILTIILIVVTVQIALGLQPVLFESIDNVTASGAAGTAIVVILKTLYWVLIGAVIVIEFLFGLGLMDLVKKMNKFNF